MLHRRLTPLAAIAVALLSTAPTASTQLSEMVFTVADAIPPGLAPGGFTFGPGGGGPVSPAGCRIQNVQNPHASTWYAQRGTRVPKGNAVAGCNRPVPYLSLSVSVLDPDNHRVLAKQAKPKEVENQAQIESLETIVKCVNSNPTRYQVTALGVSQENGKFYDQIEFGKIDTVNCGHD
jgi:hypothetical protein